MIIYRDLCAIDDIANGRYRAFVVNDIGVLVFRMDSNLYAVEDRCTHLNFPLAGGRQIGCEIICRQHGGRFDIRTGKAVGSPAVDPVRTFPVRRTGDRIEIAGLGDRPPA